MEKHVSRKGYVGGADQARPMTEPELPWHPPRTFIQEFSNPPNSQSHQAKLGKHP
jgi:hypothetical protein